MPGCLQLIGTRQQRHDMEGFDGATARTVGLGHVLLSIGSKLGILPLRAIERTVRAGVSKQDRAG